MISIQYLYNLPRYILRKFYIPYNRIKIRISGASVGENCRILTFAAFCTKKS